MPDWTRDLTGVVTKTGDYTATGADSIILVDASGGAVTITLPAITSIGGRKHYIKKTDTSTNKVTVTSTSNIDGVPNQILDEQYEVLKVKAGTAEWHAVHTIDPEIVVYEGLVVTINDQVIYN
ncbi:hypothetical protein LCGC14_2820290 [marine sediment metagenome]|uniref:Uncharacterized protein n=1 Tax=marine sediment metagenome TaxID=412755 RepID=A0A0F9AQL1_9ZZZZ